MLSKQNLEILWSLKPRQMRKMERFCALAGEALEQFSSYVDKRNPYVESYYRSLTGSSIERRGSIRNLLQRNYNTPDVDEMSTFKFKTKIDEYFNAGRQKQPFDTKHGHWIGVEIECFIPRDSFEESYEDDEGEIRRCGDDDCYYHIKRDLKRLKIGNVYARGDGSISCDEEEYYPIEFNVCFVKNNPLNLKRLCEYLREMGAKVNRSCGLHVHLDCRDLISTRQVTDRATRIANQISLLAKLVPSSRRDNSYCRLGMGKYRGRHEERYYAVNRTAYHKFRTIEVRLHSGTVDFTKIYNWARLIYDISRTPSLRMNRCVTLPQLFHLLYGDRFISETEFLREYFERRLKLFNNYEADENTAS